MKTLRISALGPIFESIADTIPNWVRSPEVIWDAIKCRYKQMMTIFAPVLYWNWNFVFKFD